MSVSRLADVAPSTTCTYNDVVRHRQLATIGLLVLVACHHGALPPRVIVLGIDGLDPHVVELLIAEGKLPTFAALQHEGAHGALRGSKPLQDAILWTTIATGKTPEQHSIALPELEGPHPGEAGPPTAWRRPKAIWNIVGEAGRRVAMVGWQGTVPGKPVHGVMVPDISDHDVVFPTPRGDAWRTRSRVYPPERARVLLGMLRKPSEVTARELAAFVRVPAEQLVGSQDAHLDRLRSALATADGFRRIGLHLWKDERPDLLLLDVRSLDVASHLFGSLFRAGKVTPELSGRQARYGDTVEAMYCYADELVADFLRATDAGTTLVVLSNHGFALGPSPHDAGGSSEVGSENVRGHRSQGLIYFHGRAVKPRHRIVSATHLDVAPTLLALAGLPAARDMPGRVLSEAFDLPSQTAAVATYETIADAGRDSTTAHERDGSNSVASTSAAYREGYARFESGCYRDAALIYKKLARRHPDDPAVRTSLAGALGARGHFDRALRELDEAIRLDPLGAEAYYNRGLIYERRGQRGAAVDQYRTALRYRSDHPPSRRALQRLTGSADPLQTRTKQEQKALALAARASEAAQRADYATATKLLEKAAERGPNLALIEQYRANVAYLSGDRTGAVQALRRALVIEPDNQLLRANLTRLEAR